MRASARAAGRQVGDAVPVDERGRGHVRRSVPDDQLAPARDDERPGVEGVRRDEGDRHRVQTPDEHGPAVREVVAGRARRGRADDAVAAEPAECLAADGPFELDHPADDGARDDEVVDRDAPLVPDLDLEGRKLLDVVLAGEDASESRLQLVARRSRRESRRGRS